MIEKVAMPRYDACMATRDNEIRSLRAELAHARAAALPSVSGKEMADIEKRHKKPTSPAARTMRVRWSGK